MDMVSYIMGLNNSSSGGGTTNLYEEIYKTDTPTNEITLSKSYKNYKFLIFDMNNYIDDLHWGSQILTPYMIDKAREKECFVTLCGAAGVYLNANVLDDTHLLKAEGVCNIYRIVGVKDGSASSGVGIKTKTYVGNGNTTNTIEFDEQPTFILGWSGRGEDYTMSFVPFTWGELYPCGMYRSSGSSQSGLEVDVSYDGNSITLSAPNSMSAFNGNGGTYTIQYI